MMKGQNGQLRGHKMPVTLRGCLTRPPCHSNPVRVLSTQGGAEEWGKRWPELHQMGSGNNIPAWLWVSRMRPGWATEEAKEHLLYCITKGNVTASMLCVCVLSTFPSSSTCGVDLGVPRVSCGGWQGQCLSLSILYVLPVCHRALGFWVPRV